MSDTQTALSLWPTYRGLGLYRPGTAQAAHANDQHNHRHMQEWSAARLRSGFEPSFYAVPGARSFQMAINRLRQFEEMAIQQQRRKS
jgi:hypothetical protein